jgi:predicted small lipoprotein YifL
MNFSSGLLVVMLLGACLLGCGQKGPLMLPDAPKHKRSVPALPDVSKPKADDNAPAAPATPVTTSPSPSSSPTPNSP